MAWSIVFSEEGTVMNAAEEKTNAMTDSVEALANQNLPPELFGPLNRPRFSDDFNWDEDARVWNTIKELAQHAERVWPSMVSHLGDERYCITYRSFNNYSQNVTVGKICGDIIMRNLTHAYVQRIRTTNKQTVLKLRSPRFLQKGETLKEWCLKRSDKKLYELQIEVCQWISDKLDDAEFVNESPEIRGELKEAVKEVITSLENGKAAISWHGFGAEEVFPYSRPVATPNR
jgi:hypothetical protein